MRERRINKLQQHLMMMLLWHGIHDRRRRNYNAFIKYYFNATYVNYFKNQIPCILMHTRRNDECMLCEKMNIEKGTIAVNSNMIFLGFNKMNDVIVYYYFFYVRMISSPLLFTFVMMVLSC